MNNKNGIEPVSSNDFSYVENKFGTGEKSYSVILSSRFLDQCDLYDKEWDETFRTFVASKFPYTMSPKTTKMIAKLSTILKKKMKNLGFKIDPWRVEISEEPYVVSVLSKVMATEPIEPIIQYTNEVALHIKKLKKENPEKPVTVRSFFSGACVADKCLLATLNNMGEHINIISSDSSADSVAVGVLNLEVWNQNLPEKDRYEIHIVNGKIPAELLERERIIVLQVCEALKASSEDTLVPINYDVLLIDNGLQYVTRRYSEQLISSCLNSKGDSGLYIATLGSDSNIKVEFSNFFHLKNIIKAIFLKDVRKSFLQDATHSSPFGLSHKYDYKVLKDGTILITGMKTEGTARMYNWLAHLILRKQDKLPEVMKAIKTATELSRANKAVETSPFDYHQSIINAIESKGMGYKVIAKPLDFEDFGWKEVGKDQFEKEDEVVDGGTMMERCKIADPLVIRISRIYVD